MRKSTPAFQFYPNDFLGSEIVALLEADGIGAYMLLMCHAWSPKGLPTDPAALAKLARMTRRRFAEVWPVMAGSFEERGGRLYHHRLEAEREKQAIYREKQKANAGKRWHPDDVQSQSHGNATAVPPHSQRNALRSSVFGLQETTPMSEGQRSSTLESSGSEPRPMPNAEALELPDAAERFLAEFYGSAGAERQADVRAQLRAALSPYGARIRGDDRARAHDAGHLALACATVLRSPPRQRNMAIVVLLKTLATTLTEYASRAQKAEDPPVKRSVSRPTKPGTPGDVVSQFLSPRTSVEAG